MNIIVLCKKLGNSSINYEIFIFVVAHFNISKVNDKN